MRSKAIQDLLRLSDEDFFKQISIGYEQILKHAISLNDAAKILAKEKRVDGNLVLASIAEEEAAKCLILMDAVRCPRKPEKVLSDHLWKFNDHLSKAIYSETCYVTASDFAELVNYVDNERKEFYLDGPNDFDWIWRNRLVSGREEALYVDYVEMEDGRHVWLIPNKHEFWMEDDRLALSLTRALYDTGCTTPSSLRAIAEFWRARPLLPSFTFNELRGLNIQTMEELEKRNLLRQPSEREARIILDTWSFPMHSLDMKMFKGNKEELRIFREQWLRWIQNSEDGG